MSLLKSMNRCIDIIMSLQGLNRKWINHFKRVYTNDRICQFQNLPPKANLNTSSNFSLMPPKRQASVSSIVINTISTNKFRSNAASDLVTKSQAALSSQASVLQKTQNSQSSQDNNYNFALPDNDDMQFNRQEMSEVQISKEEQEMIQKILQVARKGKINSKNAFEIPIKVVSSETIFTVNNKFWKFASELLSASMSIYDKRVENMYLSTGAFESKLSRIGFDIKSRKQGEKYYEPQDDVHADQQSKARKNRQERHEILKITVQDFSGALNLEDESIIGYQTLERKDKLDIRNVQNKFIADPTFERTQKTFDSFSLKSLMLNIFELSTELDVRIFMKSDLEWQKLKKEENERTQQFAQLQGPSSLSEQEQMKENASFKSETQTNKSLGQAQAFNGKSGQQPLPYYILKHIEVSKGLMEQNNFLGEIQKFIIRQPELKQDYLNRKVNSKKPNQIEVQQDPSQNLENLNFGQIIQRERNQFSEIIKQFHERYDEDMGVHHFSQIQDGEGLYQTNNFSQTQSFENSHPLRFSQSHMDGSLHHETNSMPSMPVSFQQNFYAWDQQNNIIQPIMPWEIEFKNLQLTKKMKRGSKSQKKQGKKNIKKSQMPIIDFQLSILDRKQVLAQKDTKKKFESQKIFNMKLKERNTVSKEFDIVHSEYHSKFSNRFLNSRNTIIKFQYMDENEGKHDPGMKNRQNFFFDLDQNMMDQSLGQNKELHNDNNNADEETRFLQQENYPINQESMFFLSVQKMTKNTSYAGIQMGVNNIRQIKAMIVNEINEKGKTTLDFINRMLVNLSPQQLFTIFLHLTNEYQYEIYNQDDEECTVVLTKAGRGRRNNSKQVKKQKGDVEI